MRIGFVGLGHMGLPMALNLIKNNHQVFGFDLQKEALREFEASGGIAVKGLSDPALHQAIIITMLQSGQQVEAVCLGKEGIYQLTPHTLHIDCSTIDVETTQNLHKEAQIRKLSMCDAPVSGGVLGAREGLLTFMVGGEESTFLQAKPILAAMGKNIFHAGPVGRGQAAKICNNMILGISMIAVSEAFVLAEELGLAKQKLFEIVNNASGQCWVMSKYTPVPGLLPKVPANEAYAPGFTVAMMLKDLKLSEQAAQTLEKPLKLAKNAAAIYQQFLDEGYADLDFSAIIKTMQP